jgi:ABC-type hemin transport system ATPase subunit
MQQGQLLAVDAPAQALSPQRLQQVFGIQAFYLPHPVSQQPMLVMDPLPPAAQANASAPFFTS